MCLEMKAGKRQKTEAEGRERMEGASSGGMYGGNKKKKHTGGVDGGTDGGDRHAAWRFI